MKLLIGQIIFFVPFNKNRFFPYLVIASSSYLTFSSVIGCLVLVLGLCAVKMYVT